MKIDLIFPHIRDMVEIYGKSPISGVLRRVLGWGESDYTPPLSLLMLAAVTPPDIEVKILDERVEKIDFDDPTDLVGISVVTRSAPRAYEIASEYQKRGVKVVLGGIHPSAMPQEAVLHADAIVTGEGEGIWPEVLRDFQQGALKPIYRGRPQMDLDKLPFARRELIRNPKTYVTLKTLCATRGCQNTCTFCAAGVGLIKKYRKRSICNVISELEQVPGWLTDFEDDNLAWEPEYAKELFRAMIPLRLRWSGGLSSNALNDPELIELAAESGCYLLGIGFESLSPEALKNCQKDKTNHPELYSNQIRQLQQAGITVWGNFIVGFDEDDQRTFPELVDFILQNNLEVAMANVLTPYPGSLLYKQQRDQNRLLHQEWKYYEGADGLCTFIPRQMTAEELMEHYLELCEKIYSMKSILSRAFKSKTRFSFGTLAALHLNLQNRQGVEQQREQVKRYKEFLKSANITTYTTRYNPTEVDLQTTVA